MFCFNTKTSALRGSGQELITGVYLVLFAVMGTSAEEYPSSTALVLGRFLLWTCVVGVVEDEALIKTKITKRSNSSPGGKTA